MEALNQAQDNKKTEVTRGRTPPEDYLAIDKDAKKTETPRDRERGRSRPQERTGNSRERSRDNEEANVRKPSSAKNSSEASKSSTNSISKAISKFGFEEPRTTVEKMQDLTTNDAHTMILENQEETKLSDDILNKIKEGLLTPPKYIDEVVYDDDDHATGENQEHPHDIGDNNARRGGQGQGQNAGGGAGGNGGDNGQDDNDQQIQPNNGGGNADDGGGGAGAGAQIQGNQGQDDGNGNQGGPPGGNQGGPPGGNQGGPPGGNQGPLLDPDRYDQHGNEFSEHDTMLRRFSRTLPEEIIKYITDNNQVNIMAVNTQTTDQYLRPIVDLNNDINSFALLWNETKAQDVRGRFANTMKALITFLNQKHPGLLTKFVNQVNNPDLPAYIEHLLTRTSTFHISQVDNNAFRHPDAKVIYHCNLPRYAKAQEQLVDCVTNCFNLFLVNETVTSGFSYLAPQNVALTDDSVVRAGLALQSTYAPMNQSPRMVALSTTDIANDRSNEFFNFFNVLPAMPLGNNDVANEYMGMSFTQPTLIRIPAKLRPRDTNFSVFPLYHLACDICHPEVTIPNIVHFASRKCCRLLADSGVKTHIRLLNKSCDTPISSLTTPIKLPTNGVLFTHVETTVTFLGYYDNITNNLRPRPDNTAVPRMLVSYHNLLPTMNLGDVVGNDENHSDWTGTNDIHRPFTSSVNLSSLYQDTIVSTKFIDDFMQNNGSYAIEPTLIIRNSSFAEKFQAKCTVKFLQGSPIYLAGYLLSLSLKGLATGNYNNLMFKLKAKCITKYGTRSQKHLAALRLLLTNTEYTQLLVSIEERIRKGDF